MRTILLISLIASLVSLSAVADAVKTDSNVKLSKWFEVPRNEALQVLEDRESYPFSFNWEVVQEQERASARISGDYSGLRWPKTQMDLSSRNPWWKSPRRLLRVVDGWLAGYNAGEFGAELWWFSKDGSRHYKISNHQVNQFLPDGDVVYAAEGSPSDLVEGSIIKLEKRGGRWKAKTFAKPEMAAPCGLVKMDDASFMAVDFFPLKC